MQLKNKSKQIFLGIGLMIVLLAGLAFWSLGRDGVYGRAEFSIAQVSSFGPIISASWADSVLTVKNVKGEARSLKKITRVQTTIPQAIQVVRGNIYVVREYRGMNVSQEIVRVAPDGSASVVYGGSVTSYRVSPDENLVGVVAEDTILRFNRRTNATTDLLSAPITSARQAVWIENRIVEYPDTSAPGGKKQVTLW